MMKVTILLLLIVHVLGKNPVLDDPYPSYIKETIIYNPSVPIAHSGGSTVLKPNDFRIPLVVHFVIDRINLKYVEDEEDMLEVQKTGKVELKVIDNRQHMPYEQRFIKNIYTFEKLMCISRDGLTKVNLHGLVSIIFDQDENFVNAYIFMNLLSRDSSIPLKEKMRRKSISGDIIDDEEKNENGQRRHSLKLEMDRHRNRRMDN